MNFIECKCMRAVKFLFGKLNHLLRLEHVQAQKVSDLYGIKNIQVFVVNTEAKS